MHTLAQAVETHDFDRVLQLVLERGADGLPRVRDSYRRESEHHDYKRGLPAPRAANNAAWAEVASHVLAFHNHDGGVLFFGIDDNFEFVGTRDRLDEKMFNDQIRRFVPDSLHVYFTRALVQADQRYLGVALVRRHEHVPLRAAADAPIRNDNQRLFSAGDLCVRENDSTTIYRGPEVERYLASRQLPISDSKYITLSSSCRILRPDYSSFLFRKVPCDRVLEGLRDPRTFVTSLSGIGGIGKTSIACWATLRAHKEGWFSYIVSLSAKDRDLTDRGIQAVPGGLSSFDEMLNMLLDALGFSDECGQPTESKEVAVRAVLPDAKMLLLVDNLETVSDPRILNFLETLPVGVKAVVTSRTSLVKTSAFPVPVGPLTQTESLEFFVQVAIRKGKDALARSSQAEKERIVSACSRVPLAIEWLVGRSRGLETALALAGEMEGSGRRDAELLEFCFRQVHSQLSPAARDVLASLTLDEDPQVVEAIAAATGRDLDAVSQGLEELEDSSLLERVWDPKRRDLSYKTLALTRRFGRLALAGIAGAERVLRERLRRYYEGRGISDPVERAIVVKIRRGEREPGAAMLEQARVFFGNGDIAKAEEYFRRAIDRDPSSWKAHRELGELLKRQERHGDALLEYASAGRCAPARGPDRALIFREWGLLVKRSGRESAHEDAISKFLIAYKETPGEPMLLHAYADSLMALGQTAVARPLLETLCRSESAKSRSISYALLERAYRALGEIVLLAELRRRREADLAAAEWQADADRRR